MHKGWICPNCNVFWNDQSIGGKESKRYICPYCNYERTEKDNMEVGVDYAKTDDNKTPTN